MAFAIIIERVLFGCSISVFFVIRIKNSDIASIIIFDRIDLRTSLTIGVLPGFNYFVCRIVEGVLILHIVIRGGDRFKHTIVRIMQHLLAE